MSTSKNFLRFQRDDNMVPVQTGGSILTADISASPKVSPLSVTNASVTTIAVPTNAAEIVVLGSAAFRIGESVALSQYFTVPASTVMAFGVADMDSIFVQGDAGVITLNFYFITV